MTVDLFKTSSNKLRVNKSLTNQLTKSFTCKGSCDLLSPIITLNYDTQILSRNYAYIAAFGRYYYYSKPPEVVPGQSITLYLHVDVRQTYASAIRSCKARVTRSQSNYDVYIPDNMIINKSNVKMTQRKLGSGFTRANKYYVLIGG